MIYTRKPEDVSYRMVRLAEADVPKYQEFTRDEQQIDYLDGVVLEIKKKDGTEELEYAFPPSPERKISYRFEVLAGIGKKKVAIRTGIALTRVYVVDTTTGLSYRIPGALPVDKDKYRYFLLPADCGSVKLEGDKYFEKAYALYQY